MGMLTRAAVILLFVAGCAHESEPVLPPFVPASGEVAPAGIERREATYCGTSRAGHLPANGARYDPGQLTAAHKHLPVGSIVRVTREDTGANVIVRINDRGPFGSASRIIDVSYSAAQALDMIRAG